MKRLLVVLLALFLGAGTAFAQSAESSIDIVDINGSRYAEGGQTTMVIDFQNFAESPDPALFCRSRLTVNPSPTSR